jgi:hypothetical protein
MIGVMKAKKTAAGTGGAVTDSGSSANADPATVQTRPAGQLFFQPCDRRENRDTQ